MENTNNLSHALIEAIDNYSKKSGIARSTITAYALGDAGFYGRLKKGRGFTSDTYDAMMHWLQAQEQPRVTPPAWLD